MRRKILSSSIKFDLIHTYEALVFDTIDPKNVVSGQASSNHGEIVRNGSDIYISFEAQNSSDAGHKNHMSFGFAFMQYFY